MGDDTYRRPRREHSSDETFGEKFNRYFLRQGPGKSLGESYNTGKPAKNLYSKATVETNYPKGWKPKSLDKTSRRFSSKYVGKLETNLGVVSAALIGASALFMTPNLTGNVIWNLSVGSTNSVGVVLFVLGLSGMLFCTRKK